MKHIVKVAVITALIVTSYMSFILAIVNVGFNKNFILIWLTNWLTAFLLAIPSLLIIAPFIKKKLKKSINTSHKNQ